ncbi:MAG: hypothetical protein AB8B55_22745 [Mariniblastus sp.]
MEPNSLLGQCNTLFDLIAEKGLVQAAVEHEAEHAAMRATNLGSLVFDLVVLGLAVAVFFQLSRIKDKMWQRFAIMAAGVLIFEVFTAPLWINDNLGRWAYVYQDVSWILTVGWTAMILFVIVMVDHWLPDWKAPWRFATYLGLLLVLVTIAEMVVVGLGIRKYAPEVVNSVSGVNLLGVPIEILFYVPVFTALVIAFYKYWAFVLDDAVLIPMKRRKWVRGIVLGFIAVFMFELVIEPMVENHKFPAWSNVYRDVSFIMTGIWVLLIGVAAVVVDRFVLGYPVWFRFLAAVAIVAALLLPVESWMIINGYRVYGDSAVANFTGFTTPITGVAVEVAFAVPCYLALIISFIRYWEIVLDNGL